MYPEYTDVDIQGMKLDAEAFDAAADEAISKSDYAGKCGFLEKMIMRGEDGKLKVVYNYTFKEDDISDLLLIFVTVDMVAE